MDNVNGSMNAFQSKTESDALQYLDISATSNNTTSLLSMYSNETELNFNASNLTSNVVNWRDQYKPVLDTLMMLLFVGVMLAMGCDVTWHDLLRHFKKPIGLLLGIVTQFGILPLSAFCILLLSGITGLHATGVLIISCSPGGVLSNTFTYFCDGELPLSAAMTCVSTIVAMGLMPLNIWLYGRHFESEDLVIPYIKMAISLIVGTIPFFIGMLLKWKFPRLAKYITKVGGYTVIILLLSCISLEIVLFPNLFHRVSLKIYVAVFLLPTIGLTLSYGLAYVLKQNKRICRTIAIECGIQSVPIAVTVIALSFPIEVQENIALIPWIYGIGSLTGGTIICLSYQFYSKCSKKTVDIPEVGIVQKKDNNKQQSEKDGEVSFIMKN